METTKNRLRLDYKDLPDLKAALGGLEPGSRFTLELSLMVSANSDDSIEADIESVEYETGDEESPGTSGEAEPTSEEPIMVELMRKSTSKDAQKAAAAPADEEPVE